MWHDAASSVKICGSKTLSAAAAASFAGSSFHGQGTRGGTIGAMQGDVNPMWLCIRLLRHLGQYIIVRCYYYYNGHRIFSTTVWQSDQPDDISRKRRRGKGKEKVIIVRFSSTPPLHSVFRKRRGHILRHHDPPLHQPQGEIRAQSGPSHHVHSAISSVVDE